MQGVTRVHTLLERAAKGRATSVSHLALTDVVFHNLPPDWFIRPGCQSVLFFFFNVVVVQSLGCVWLFMTPWTAARQASLSFTISWSLLKLMSIESMMPSNHLILCHPFSPSIFPSIRVFSNESVLRIRWPKDWSFRLSHSPSNEYSGLISFRMDWFDLLAVLLICSFWAVLGLRCCVEFSPAVASSWGTL